MEDRYIDILKKSSFDELTREEKELIADLCSDQESFEMVKDFMQSMSSVKTEEYRMKTGRVKEKLDSEFKEVYGTEGGFRFLNFLFPPLTPIYSKPGLQIAFVLLFIFTVYTSIEYLNVDNTPKNQYAQNEEQKNPEQKSAAEKNDDVEKAEESEKLGENGIDAQPMEVDLTAEVTDAERGSFDAGEDMMVMDELSIAGMEDSFSEAMPTSMSPGFTSSPIDTEEEFLFLIEPLSTSPEMLDDLFTTF